MREKLWFLALLGGLTGLVAAFALPGLEAFRGEPREVGVFGAAEEGRVLYAAGCARCHGRLAEGTERGPVLIAPAPGPNAPGRRIFLRAARGCHSGHGRAGRTPGFADLPDEAIDGIIAFLRRIERPGETP